MPAKSAAQQRAAGMALAVKRGETPMPKMKGAVTQMAKSMTQTQLKEYATTRKKK